MGYKSLHYDAGIVTNNIEFSVTRRHQKVLVEIEVFAKGQEVTLA